MYGWGKGAASHTTLVVSLLDWGKAWKAQTVAEGISVSLRVQDWV